MLRNTGYEAQVEGDSFCVAFHHPRDAANFCVAIQVGPGGCSTVQTTPVNHADLNLEIVMKVASKCCPYHRSRFTHVCCFPCLAQAELMVLPWPSELLALDSCKPIYMSRTYVHMLPLLSMQFLLWLSPASMLLHASGSCHGLRPVARLPAWPEPMFIVFYCLAAHGLTGRSLCKPWQLQTSSQKRQCMPVQHAC